jgi:tRNA(Glu) U13 pseudouridine synthase TruD
MLYLRPGLQRFGKTATRNAEVGKAYLLARADPSMYIQAVDSLLGPQPWGSVTQGEQQARTTWQRTQDPKVVFFTHAHDET